MKKIIVCLLAVGLAAQAFAQESVRTDWNWEAKRNYLDITYGPASGYTLLGDFVLALVQIADKGEGEQQTLGCFNLNYHYQCLKWLAVGVKVNYSPQLYKGSENGDYQLHWVNTMASVQFTYLNRETVRLYSGIDLGMTSIISKNNSAEKPVAAQPWAAVNLTLFGVTFGKDVYGLAELNAGCEAAVKLGLGVRF